MANRPGSLCVLQRGKSLYGQANFVDTFNWLVSCMNNLKGGTGIDVDWSVPDQPTINAQQESAPNGGDGSGPGFAVTNITADAQSDGVTLSWTYSDGTQDSQFFPIGGGGEPGEHVDSLNTLKGDVQLVKEDDSNITFTVDGNNIKVGVYYL